MLFSLSVGEEWMRLRKQDGVMGNYNVKMLKAESLWRWVNLKWKFPLRVEFPTRRSKRRALSRGYLRCERYGSEKGMERYPSELFAEMVEICSDWLTSLLFDSLLSLWFFTVGSTSYVIQLQSLFMIALPLFAVQLSSFHRPTALCVTAIHFDNKAFGLFASLMTLFLN